MSLSMRIPVALVVTALLTMPAGALSLKLGGNSLLNLGGSNSNQTNAAINVDTGDLTGNGSAGVGLSDTSIELFGSPGSDDAGLSLGTGDDLLGDLFGTGGTETSASVDLGLDGLLDLFGPAGNTSPSGGDTGNGSGSSGVKVAALGDPDATACFVPDGTQMDRLVNRHRYDAATISSWRGANAIQVIEVGLCPDAAMRLAEIVAANRNVMALQSYLSGESTIRSQLGAQGHSVEDVVAVDRSGATLVIYVI
ncbi:MAG: hypothetical protein ABL866_11335 [Devosia sp.]